MYFDNGTDKRIKFVSRDAVEGKIAENRLGDLSNDEIFAYRNFLLTDLKHPESQQAMPAMNLSVFFEGFEEAAFGGNDCEGGSYQYICFYNTSGSDELNPARLLRQFMDESYGTGDHISTTYNGATLSELEEHYNQIMNSLPPANWMITPRKKKGKEKVSSSMQNAAMRWMISLSPTVSR